MEYYKNKTIACLLLDTNDQPWSKFVRFLFNEEGCISCILTRWSRRVWNWENIRLFNSMDTIQSTMKSPLSMYNSCRRVTPFIFNIDIWQLPLSLLRNYPCFYFKEEEEDNVWSDVLQFWDGFQLLVFLIHLEHGMHLHVSCNSMFVLLLNHVENESKWDQDSRSTCLKV